MGREEPAPRPALGGPSRGCTQQSQPTAPSGCLDPSPARSRGAGVLSLGGEDAGLDEGSRGVTPCLKAPRRVGDGGPPCIEQLLCCVWVLLFDCLCSLRTGILIFPCFLVRALHSNPHGCSAGVSPFIGLCIREPVQNAHGVTFSLVHFGKMSLSRDLVNTQPHFLSGFSFI